jgi:hypothetical protein
LDDHLDVRRLGYRGAGSGQSGDESMKTVYSFPELTQANEAISKLKARGLYACLSGCQSRGYEVLMRDEDARSSKESGLLDLCFAGGNA